MLYTTLKFDTSAMRFVMLAGILATVAMTFVVVRWCVGSTLAGRAVYKEIADVAVELTPSDPQTHFTSAVLHEKTFAPEDLPIAIREYEQAVALSPHDFRYWLELGQSRSRAGDAIGAEKALRVAIKLAPNYSRVQWALGNLLLRDGRSEEAFVEIRRAADSDPVFAKPAVASAWQLFEGDVARIREYVGTSANLNAAFAAVLTREKRFGEAVEVWNSVPDDLRRTEFRQLGEEMIQKMIEAKQFRAAIGVVSTLTDDKDKFAVGKISNGGFEAENPKSPGPFDWQIAEGIEPQIGIDNSQHHGGAISLTIVFNANDASAFRNITQTMAVEPNHRYSFEVFAKSDLKKADASVKWEIVDAADPKIVYATTESVAATSDWTPLRVEFTTAANTDGVVLRLARSSCADKGRLCTIAGRVWFDDFSLN